MTTTNRFEYIDSLRAIAAFLVIIIHSVAGFVLRNPFTTERDGWIVAEQGFIRPAFVGIWLFFLISGFVIPESLKQGNQAFIIRRFFRLFPLFWISIFIDLAATLLLHGTQSLSELFVTMTMVPSLFGQQPTSIYWTLEIELLFYALCLFGFLNTSFLALSSTLLLFLAFLQNFSSAIPLELAKISLYLGTMYWGALWRKWQENQASIALVSAMPIFFFLFVPYLSLYFDDQSFWQFTSLSAALGLFILGTTALRLNVSWLSYLGKISYSLYLLHMICMRLIVRYSLHPSAPEWIQHPSTLFCLLAPFLLTIPLSMLTYHWIELPCIALGKRLVQKVRPLSINTSQSP